MSERHRIISEYQANTISVLPQNMTADETLILVQSHEQLRRDWQACQVESARLREALEQIANLTISDLRSTPPWVVIATEALRNGGGS